MLVFQPSAISHFETGKRTPSLQNLQRLAEALGVDVDYLIEGKRTPNASRMLGDRLLRTAGQLSTRDQEVLVDFAEMLVSKKAHRASKKIK